MLTCGYETIIRNTEGAAQGPLEPVSINPSLTQNPKEQVC